MSIKKKWETPKLIVLVRGRPHEKVLTTCKQSGFSSGSSNHYSLCVVDNEGVCGDCVVNDAT